MHNLQQILTSQEAPNTIVMMTAADLKKLIDDTNAYTRRAVEEQYQPHYYDSADLQKLFKISRTTLYNWEKEGKLPKPYIPDGTDKKLWVQSEIRAWVDAGKVGRYIHK